MSNNVFTTAKRFPTPPTRDEVAEDERAAFDHHRSRIDAFMKLPYIVDGRPYGVPHFEALLVSPPIAYALAGPAGVGAAVIKTQDRPGSYTNVEHEFIDLVIAFDSGYWALVAGHTPAAIEAGMPIETLKALAEGRIDDLSDDDRQIVHFVRAVRDGGVDDEMWFAIKERFGTDRGVVDFVCHILLLLFHHRFCWAVGAPEMKREDWWQLIRDFEDGTRTVEDARREVERMIASTGFDVARPARG